MISAGDFWLRDQSRFDEDRYYLRTISNDGLSVAPDRDMPRNVIFANLRGISVLSVQLLTANALMITVVLQPHSDPAVGLPRFFPLCRDSCLACLQTYTLEREFMQRMWDGVLKPYSFSRTRFGDQTSYLTYETKQARMRKKRKT